MPGGPDAAATRLNQLPGNEFFNTEGRNIRPGDRNTRTDKFDAHVKSSLPPAGQTAHLNLGVHVWHSDADFLELEKSLKKYANRPDWWYCNENEFLAYSYMIRHTRIAGRKPDGKKVTFTLELPMRVWCERLTGDPSRVAFLYGPIVLAGLTDAERTLHLDPERPEAALRRANEREWGSWTTEFLTTTEPEAISFVPLYQVGYERYCVYFRMP